MFVIAYFATPEVKPLRLTLGSGATLHDSTVAIFTGPIINSEISIQGVGSTISADDLLERFVQIRLELEKTKTELDKVKREAELRYNLAGPVEYIIGLTGQNEPPPSLLAAIDELRKGETVQSEALLNEIARKNERLAHEAAGSASSAAKEA